MLQVSTIFTIFLSDIFDMSYFGLTDISTNTDILNLAYGCTFILSIFDVIRPIWSSNLLVFGLGLGM